MLIEHDARRLERKPGRSARVGESLPRRQRAMKPAMSAEKRVAVFSDLGRRLSAARTQRDAAQILMDAADALFGWDACTFDLCSPDEKTVVPVLYVDSIKGVRAEVSPERLTGKPGPHSQ